MPYSDIYLACPDLQERLNSVFGQNFPIEYRPSPFVDVLLSPINASNMFQSSVSPGFGKKRTVQATWKQRSTDEIVTNSDDAFGCEGDTDRADFYTQYEVSTPYVASRSFLFNDLAVRCEQNSDYFLASIYDMIQAIKVKMNKDGLSTVKSSLLGNFVGNPNSATARDIQTLTATGAYSPDAISQLQYAYQQMEWAGQKVLFYNNYELASYFRNLDIASVPNNYLGTDLGRLRNGNDVLGVFDSTLNPSYSNNTSLVFAMAPGSIQLITFNLYEGQANTISQGSLIKGIITDPFSGLKFDYVINNKCGDEVVIALRVYAEFVGMPTDVFSGNDVLEGVTFVNEFKVVNDACVTQCGA
jgi:hypothetical protein